MELLELLLAAAALLVFVVALLAGFVTTRRRGRPPLDAETLDEVVKRQPEIVEAPPGEADTVQAPLDVDLADPALADDGAGPAGATAVAPPAEPAAPAEPPAPAEPAARAEPAPAAPVERLTIRERFHLRLGRARGSLGSNVTAIFRRGLDDDAWDELEESLIAADVGVEATMELVEGLRERARQEGIRTGEQALALLKEVLLLELSVADRRLARRDAGPSVWLVTGVNGTGKTTSIGKLAARHTREGDTVVLAAADTFRAAAAEQLELWGERAGARVVRQAAGADPAAVAFDGWRAADAASADLLLVDTAGRLQNKRELMAELSKVKRVLEREAGPCDEVLLVLDATTGQNGLAQAKAFLEAVDVTGVVLTKLDGTAKGGIVIAVQRQLGIPVKLVGLGEGIDDLADFDPDAFVEALFAEGAQDVTEEDGDAGDAPGRLRPLPREP